MGQRMLGLAMLIIAAATDGTAARVGHVGMVAPDILGITIHDGRVEHGRQSAYEAVDGDVIEEQHFPHRWLKRGGQYIGMVGGADSDILLTFDAVHDRNLDTDWAGKPEHYSLESPDDPAYSKPRAPRAVHRKTKPNDMGRVGPWSFDAALLHTLYLHWPDALTEGKRYTLRIEGNALPPQDFTFSSRHLRSEAVHVSQIGFRPSDPAKVGFLSCWQGDGGGLAYAEDLPFLLVDEQSRETRFEGVLQLSKPADAIDEDAYERNYNGTDVYLADFSSFAKPGTYRLVVPGVGCSYPFPIEENVWQDAFRISARGFYHMRSGIALGPPYTDYERPRCFHPDDGQRVYASTTTLMGSGNGPLGHDIEKDNFGNLVAGKTDAIVPDAWGGYMDAGDWDRRVQHLLASQLLIELAGLFPEYFEGRTLNIPESGNALPDIVDEALFNLDFYRRLQTPGGGIRGGIESEEHPRMGEASWQESLTVLAYAPGRWSSYQYVGVAAEAAFWLEKHAPERAAPYRESALRAMAWAEKEANSPASVSVAAAGAPWGHLIGGLLCLTVLALCIRLCFRFWPRWGVIRRAALTTVCFAAVSCSLLAYVFYVNVLAFSTNEAAENAVRDARNYAAAALFRLTGDAAWHGVFEATTAMTDPEALLFHWRKHDQEHGAWVYARTERSGMNEAIKTNCRNAILRAARERLETSDKAGFRWTKFAWRPFGIGVPSSPADAVVLVRAHVLTGEEKYLRGAVLASQVGAGANPSNMCFTTGVGIAYPQHPLHLDSRLTHQAPPPGLTVFGPRDFTSAAFAGDWGRKLLRPHCYPDLEAWPAMESYMDVFWNSPICEYTIHVPMAPNAYVWGYLAARPTLPEASIR